MRPRAWWLGVAALLGAATVRAETGAEGWLRYAPLPSPAVKQYAAIPGRVVALGDSPVARSAAAELERGMHAMLGRELVTSAGVGDGDAFVLGSSAQIAGVLKGWPAPALAPDGFAVQRFRSGGRTYWVVAGGMSAGSSTASFMCWS